MSGFTKKLEQIPKWCIHKQFGENWKGHFLKNNLLYIEPVFVRILYSGSLRVEKEPNYMKDQVKSFKRTRSFTA
jgi:uncharacterized membrane protein YesL